MNKILRFSFFLIFFTSLFTIQSYSQSWYYRGEISFPAADTGHVQPYSTTVDSNGRVYVASSRVTNANAHNAIFYADSADTVLTKMIDFTENGDSDTLSGNIGGIRGIAAIGTDIAIVANVPYQRSKPNTVASLYYYKDADTNQVDQFGFYYTGAGYGTYINGLAFTKDTIAFTGIDFQTSIRFFNFSYGLETPARGSWIPLGTYPVEPGGPKDPTGYDVIRDIATVPEADYTNPETPFYTTRNSISSSNTTGGIAIWTGGTETNPESYIGTRVQDAVGDLSFDRAIPYGITVDKDGLLWVAGTDSTRRWVKAYSVVVNFAQEMYELPGQFSGSNADENGAPMKNPSDVALSSDGKTAYVVDGGSGKVFVFKYGNPTAVNENPAVVYDFTLNQNYPNPFNPSTVINYSLPEAGNVKLIVTNTLGQQVAVLVDNAQSAGNHSARFNAANLASGIYLYSLTTDAGTISKKMMLLK